MVRSQTPNIGPNIPLNVRAELAVAQARSLRSNQSQNDKTMGTTVHCHGEQDRFRSDRLCQGSQTLLRRPKNHDRVPGRQILGGGITQGQSVRVQGSYCSRAGGFTASAGLGLGFGDPHR